MTSESKLTRWILVGLFVGTVLGQILYDPTWNQSQPLSTHGSGGLLSFFEFFGFTVFMGLLKMLIIPLIAASVLMAVTSVGDFGKLGRLGAWTLLYYAVTMIIAVVLGLSCVSALSPGDGIRESASITVDAESKSLETEEASKVAAGGLRGVLENLVRLMVPTNIIKAMAEGHTLSVIVFFIFFGVVVTMLGERGRVVSDLAEVVTEVMMKMVEIVLWLAPPGVFCLLTVSVAKIGLGVFGESIGLYMLTVLTGLLIHAFVVLPGILWICTRENPFRYLMQMRSAVLMALGTSSSSATLPVTIECATTEGGVSQRAAGLVLPLGATINMDGTALYQAVAVVFMAQAVGVELEFLQLCLIAVTATLAAVGAAGIPSAGLVTMFIVVDAVNHSLQATDPSAMLIPASAIGLIIGVDRLLDMLRTAVNLWGDAVGAKLISRLDTDE